MPQDSVRVLVNPNIVSVPATMPIRIAVDLIITHNFNGVPVVDKHDELVGIITKYDLIAKRHNIKNDMTVADVMNREPLVLSDKQTIDDAIQAFVDHHKVDPIPVIDSGNKLIGVISRYDMVKMFSEYGVSFSGSKKIAEPPKKQSIFPLLAGLFVLGSIVAGIFYFLS